MKEIGKEVRSATLVFSFLLFLVLIGPAAPLYAAVANVLDNASFEKNLGGSNALRNWNSEPNRGVSNPMVADAPDGKRVLRLSEVGTTALGPPPFVGVFTFQLGFQAKPGDFASFSGLFRRLAGTPGPYMARFQIEFQTSSGAVVGTVITDAAGTLAFSRILASGKAPAGTEQVVFTIVIGTSCPPFLCTVPGGTAAFEFDSVEGTINNEPVVIETAGPVTPKQPGALALVTAKVLNTSSVNFPDAELVVKPQPGIAVVKNRGSLDGHELHFREGSVIYSIGSLGPGQDSILAIPIVISSNALPGKQYSIAIFARQKDGSVLSSTVEVVVAVESDPIFDEGTILGKVFDDRNEDGVQSKGEIGVPGVRLYTEYGVGVVTDGDGRFHIPAVKQGRHVLKVDGHTLPSGTTFVTEESLLVKTTPGLLSKVRFAVHLPDSALPEEYRKELQIWVTQGVDLTRPELNVSIEPETLKMGLGRLEREPTFRIKTNYAEFISSWRLEIQNEMGEKVWTGVGIGPPPIQIPWNGVTDTGEPIASGTYAFRLIVRDSQDREDWTPLEFFRVISKAEHPEEADKPLQIDLVGNFNIFRDGKRSIPLVAKPMVRIYGKTEPNRSVRIGETPVEVGPAGEFEQELFVTPGDKKITVSATNPEGETVSVEEKIKVKDSTFFLVALGEEELGVNLIKGNEETVGRDDAFHEDFYEDGRLSYYLKAKIKGKFLVKSRYDTSDERSQLFTNLDPDEYYPVYGDYSQIEYEGQDTRERLFILVEMDRSFLKWGSYQTDFKDTELARYNRTLSGLKIHYETMSTTKYGDAKRGFALFWSKTGNVADHNEFRATGGSLYYLRNRYVIQGSEKIRVEVRDKITGMVLENRDLIYGKDYEIDYRQGRILLREPLSSVSASDTIISNDILDGNPVFLIVDYEFENFRQFEDKIAGLRGFTHFLGDHLRIGGTAVEDKNPGGPQAEYDLRGVDALLRLGRNTKVTAEYSEAKFEQVKQATSFDGGLSFAGGHSRPVRRPREKAYLIKAESKPIKPLEVSGYIQHVAPGFNVDRIYDLNEEGLRKYGIQAKLKLHPSFYLLARHDSVEVSSQLRPITEKGIFAEFDRVRTTIGQAVLDHGKWNVIGEYMNQRLDVPLDNRIESFFSERPFGNSFGLKIAYRVLDWLTPYTKGQLTFSGKQNYQIGGGLELRANNKVKVYFEEMVGNVGDATALGVSVQKDEKTSSYATIKVRDAGLGERKVSTTIGSSHQLTERSRIYTEREYSEYSGNLPRSLTPTFFGEPPTPGIWGADIYGYETRFSDRWDLGLRFERRHLESEDFKGLDPWALSNNIRTNTWNTLSASVGYNDQKRLKLEDSVEVRFDQDAPKIRQWLTQNRLDWKINQDLSFLGRMNFGTSRFFDPSNPSVNSGESPSRFVELTTGFAYRPVASDRLNWLLKYTYLDEVANEAQFKSGDSGVVPLDERSHTFSIEGAYDLTRWLQMVEKFAFRAASIHALIDDRIWVNSYLWIHRFNFHVTRKWDFATEYRMLFQGQAADSLLHGPLVELDREIYDYVRVGIGYNFTDFDDDLRKVNDFRRNGFFVRLTGKV